MGTGNGITEKETFSSTGMPSLDHVLDGVRAGDNIVWQVNAIEDYIPFVHAFCKKSHADEIPLVYFRFGHHEQLLPEGIDANVFQLHPEAGFETFLAKVFSIIEEFGKGACYVFDNLSDLADDWYSDLMLGNFFMLACPYLYDFDTATYFAILRNRHGATVIDRIQGTAQVIIDVFNHDGKTFIHPLKVYDRCSPTMYMLHEKHGDDFKPVIASGLISEIFTTLEQPWVDLTARRLDVWARTLRRARRKLAEFNAGSIERHDMDGLKRRLVLMMIAREKQLIELAMEYLDIGDLLAIGRRIIGSGLIGGKSVGMIMARAILEKEEKALLPILEVHDSFFIGSDVFYTFLVENDMWWKRRETTKPSSFLEGLDELTLRIHEGHFREEILEQFSLMLKYFGQSPIIVRSSSLLEDAYGNAFSGKYESVFCANQGTLEQRLGDFINAVKRVYASSISRDALMYRKKRDLLEKDEQMALLVQRVSGSLKGNYFFPDLAGVAFSFNPYAWDDSIDPRAGVARLVLG
ncbi:pyruvate, phosphate dikinase, partial [Candidatus Bathyarchaeota archaeon]|nr:pyruvate, phosphate dikinase [Candidatus Bathyarchaeota archaeon]